MEGLHLVCSVSGSAFPFSLHDYSFLQVRLGLHATTSERTFSVLWLRSSTRIDLYSGAAGAHYEDGCYEDEEEGKGRRGMMMVMVVGMMVMIWRYELGHVSSC